MKKSKTAVKINSNALKTKTSFHTFLKYLLFTVVIVSPILTSYYFYSVALSSNKVESFPLDDPWIHLQFARNIIDYFSFSFYKDEIVTAGSTSPLYVFVVVIGFLVTNSEMMLSYVIGIIFFALSSLYFYKLTLVEFDNDKMLGILVCGIYIFDSYMNFIAVSGMETTMFIFLLLLGVYLYKARKTVALGIVLGLIVWARPDGTAFIAAILVDYIYMRCIVNKNNRPKAFSLKEFMTVMGIFTIFLLAYFAMNLYLSGTILANTYSAKVAVNIDSDTRINFLTVHIWNFMGGEHFKYLIPGFIVAFLMLLYDGIRRRYNGNSIYILFIFAFIFIYLIKLPMFTKFGRYFMPMVPFYIIVSMGGYYALTGLMKKFIKAPIIIKILNSLIFLTILVSAAVTYKAYDDQYAYQCKFVYDRQVKTAYWFRENSIDGDIIATHDIGAIGFYSGRKIVDIAGLLDPELASNSNKENYNVILTDFFRENGVTYVSFFREWFMMINQNPVYFSPDDKSKEALFSYKFYPERSRLLPRKALYLLSNSRNYLKDGEGGKLITAMNEILEVEPDFAQAYFYRAYGYRLIGDIKNFEASLKRAITLYPDFKEALMEYGNYLVNSGNLPGAKETYERILQIDPGNKVAIDGLKFIKDSTGGGR